MFIKCKDFERQKELSKLIGECIDVERSLNWSMEKLKNRISMVEEVKQGYLEQLNNLEKEEA